MWGHCHGIDDRIVDPPLQLTEDTSGLEADESATAAARSRCRAVDAGCPGETTPADCLVITDGDILN